jgi:hypothetical protein
MRKTIAWISLSAVLGLPPVSAIAQTGYGASPGTPSTSPFDRAWNHANESKERAAAGAAYLDRHDDGVGYYPDQHYHHHYPYHYHHYHYHYTQ